jgi:hypothetical protein
MHLLPSFVLLLILIVSWKRELLGGIIFIVLGYNFYAYYFLDELPQQSLTGYQHEYCCCDNHSIYYHWSPFSDQSFSQKEAAEERILIVQHQ